MAACVVATQTYRIAFVNSIPTTGVAVTGLSLSDDPWCVAEGTRFDPPDLRRAAVSTLLADGETYPATAYDNRVLQLRLAVEAATADDLATQIQLLTKELDKATNFLRVQPKTSQPVYFRTFRVPADRIDLIPKDKRTAIVNVDVLAEPFGYGPEEVGAVAVVNNDPAAVSNGCYFDVVNVKGDVETPAILRIDHATGVLGGITVIATRRRGTPSLTPYVLQVETFTSTSADTTLQANSALMSGAGSNYMRTTFATTTAMTSRLSSTTYHPVTATVDNRGTYRVFLRYRKTVAGDVIKVQLTTWANGTHVVNTATTLPLSVDISYADLGLISNPIGPDPVTYGYSGTELTVGGMYFSLDAQRVSGSGSLDWDVMLLVPADDRLAIVAWTPWTGPDYDYLDGTHDLVYTTTSGFIRAELPAVVVGAMPLLSPGQTNRIFFVKGGGGVLAGYGGDDITDTINVRPSYYPRYLYVRPATT